MLSWLVIVPSVYVIILLFYTMKYIVTFLQLETPRLTQKNQMVVTVKESVSENFKADTQIIVKFKEDACEETQLDIHRKNECTILHHNKNLNFQLLHS